MLFLQLSVRLSPDENDVHSALAFCRLITLIIGISVGVIAERNIMRR